MSALLMMWLTVAAPADQAAAAPMLAGRPLAEALAILQGGGLKIVFSSELVRPEMRVAGEPKENTPRRTLEALLRPHGLTVHEMRGVLVVVRSPRAQPGAVPQRVGVISGHIVEARTGTPLAAVLVQVQSTGQRALSDQAGRFELTEVPAGTQAVLVSVVGYGLVRRDVVVPADAVLEVTVPVSEGASTYVEEVTVAGSLFRETESSVAGQMILGSRDLLALRGLLADDPFRAVQSLPGVATGDDFRAEFAIRGQGPEHLGLSIDGVDSPLLFHTVRGVEDGGSLALINSDVLESATVVAGARPQRLNAHLGSAVDFTTRDGATDRLRVRGLLSVTAATVVSEGPTSFAGRGSWLVAARQSYLDWLLRKVDPEANGTFGFTDLQAKLTWPMSDRHALRVLLIGGRSMLHEQEAFPTRNSLQDGANQTLIGSLRWQFAVTSKLGLTQQIYGVAASYRNDVPDGRVRESGSDRDLTWRARMEWAPTTEALIELGGQAQTIRAARVDRTLGLTGDVTNIDVEGRGTSAAAWLHTRWSLTPRFIVSPGLRIDRWNAIAAADASPWLLAEWQVASATRLRGGVSIQRQGPSIEQLARGTSTMPLVPEYARLVDLGLERRLGEAWVGKINGYYRSEDDRLRLVGGEPSMPNGVFVPVRLPSWRNTLAGESRGASVSIERRSVNGPSGWVGYSYDRTDLTDDTTGERFPSDWDQRHTLNAYAIYRHASRTSVSARLRVGSNFPLPGYYRENTGEYFLSGERNQLRLPAYGRLDVRADRSFTYQRRRLTLYVEAVNVFNRTNVAAADPSISIPAGRVRDATENLFPLLPLAGVLLEF